MLRVIGSATGISQLTCNNQDPTALPYIRPTIPLSTALPHRSVASPSMPRRQKCASFEQLRTVLLQNSVEKKIWLIATKEWSVLSVKCSKVPSACTCGRGIKTYCTIYNKYTAAMLVVGNVCVKHFTKTKKERETLQSMQRESKRD